MARMLSYLVTFMSGAVFLGLEIVASRVLAPYFGNSVFVWGSLISVFLLALSLGYWWGGILADRWPSYRVLGGVLLVAGLWVLIIPSIYLPVSRAITDLDWELRLSVLTASLIFFMTPSVLMGMVSPYIIRLAARSWDRLGRTAGSVYAISTLGSITGALGVSFFLIPMIGARAILFSLAGTLGITALIAWTAHCFSASAAAREDPA